MLTKPPPLSRFLTPDALLTAIGTIYTLPPSVTVTHLLWAQLTPTHELSLARVYTLGGPLGVRH